jgi:hypothetical protein
VDVFFHGNALLAAGGPRVSLALRDAGGSQVEGEWLGITMSCCRFIVPRDRSVTLGLSVPESRPVAEATRVVHDARLEAWERMQECLEQEGDRQGKRRS